MKIRFLQFNADSRFKTNRPVVLLPWFGMKCLQGLKISDLSWKKGRYDIYSFEVFTENKLRSKRKSQLIVYERWVRVFNISFGWKSDGNFINWSWRKLFIWRWLKFSAIFKFRFQWMFLPPVPIIKHLIAKQTTVVSWSSTKQCKFSAFV